MDTRKRSARKADGARVSDRCPGLVVPFLILALCLGCEGHKKTALDRGRMVDPLSGQTARRAAEPQENKDPYGLAARVPLNSLANAPAIQELKKDAGKPRDWEKELRAIVGLPTGCLVARVGDAAPKTIEISVEAYFTDTGVISRASVSSSRLTEPELSCIRQRIEHASFAPPGEKDPRRINTTIILQQPKQ